LSDYELEAAGLENEAGNAQRDLEAAQSTLDETRVLVEKGLKSERDLARAQYAVEKRTIQLQALALDRLSLRYRVKSLVLKL